MHNADLNVYEQVTECSVMAIHDWPFEKCRHSASLNVTAEHASFNSAHMDTQCGGDCCSLYFS